MTLTGAERCGSGPNCTGATPSKNSSSSTVSKARSHSTPIASTLATYLTSEPRFLSFTCVWCSTL